MPHTHLDTMHTTTHHHTPPHNTTPHHPTHHHTTSQHTMLHTHLDTMYTVLNTPHTATVPSPATWCLRRLSLDLQCTTCSYNAHHLCASTNYQHWLTFLSSWMKGTMATHVGLNSPIFLPLSVKKTLCSQFSSSVLTHPQPSTSFTSRGVSENLDCSQEDSSLLATLKMQPVLK